MDLGELNLDEKTALVALLKLVVMSDGNVSENEVEQVQEVVEALGEADYQRALDNVEARFQEEKTLKEFLAGITRTEAWELIFGIILEAALSDSVERAESELLEWLGR